MLEYITTRELEGKTAGKVRIVKMKEDDFAQIEFTCPECGNAEKKREKWAEPFMQGEGSNAKFFVTCSACNVTQKMLKLKKEVKKKK